MLPVPAAWCGIRRIASLLFLSGRGRLRHLLTFQSSFLSPYPPISGSPHLHF